MNHDRVEERYHKIIWDASNGYHEVSRAISDARRLAYAVMENAPTAKALADHWLERNGRDTRREGSTD